MPSNKKTLILDNLVAELQSIEGVTAATRILLLPAESRTKSPYIGLISGPEEVVVEDNTDIRYELDVDIILLKKGRDIEEFLDKVKLKLYESNLSENIGALQIKIIGQQEVALVDADKFSSTRIIATITYVINKGVF